MKAIVQDTYGSTNVLEHREVNVPEITADEVLIRVHAAGVDRGVWHIMTGLPYPIRLAGYGLRRPKTPVLGMDMAGVVDAVGRDVTRFRPGDEVFGIGKGAFAEYARAPENKLAAKPTNLTFEQAAAVAVSGSPALQALRDYGRVKPGEKVLIIGASGGVGTFAVQIAKVFGAEVTAVCSAAKMDMVRSLGADHIIDYRRDDFAEGKRRYDVILARHRRELVVVATPARPHREGDARHNRRRDGWTVAWRQRSPDPGTPALPVRGPEAENADAQGEPPGHDRPQGADRDREDHPGDRPDIPAKRSPGRHPLPA